MKDILLFFCLLPAVLTAQTVRVRDLKFRPDRKFYNVPDSTIIYPVILTGDAAVSRKINSTILSIVAVEDEKKPAGMRTELKKAIAQGLLERFKRKVMADKLDSLKRDKPEDSTAMFMIDDCMKQVSLEPEFRRRLGRR